jgi:hypothetical protein
MHAGMPPTFNHTDLPGFSFERKASWDIEVKPFYQEEGDGFRSNYFSTCGRGCMGVRVQADDAALNFVFDISLDNNTGPRCTNTADVVAIGPWHRVDEGDAAIYYAPQGESNVHTPGPEDVGVFEFGRNEDTWSYLPDTTYRYCEDSGGRVFLHESPPLSVAEEGRILMNPPYISGTADEATLEAFDAVVRSVRW